MRLKSGHWMDAPWAVVLAPADFGKFSNDILVGNFGSGRIAAFDSKHGNFSEDLTAFQRNRGPLGTEFWERRDC